jgi:hypothetical protein
MNLAIKSAVNNDSQKLLKIFIKIPIPLLKLTEHCSQFAMSIVETSMF